MGPFPSQVFYCALEQFLSRINLGGFVANTDNSGV